MLGLPGLDCYPRPAVQQTRVVLSRLPQRLGEHTARAAGEGAEFGGVREYVPGDRQRSINWPATTRRGRLQVNTFQAERSQDVIILVDAAWDEGEPGDSVVDRALRGAAGGGPRLPGRPGPGRLHQLPVPGPLAGARPGPAALLPDRRGHADRGAGPVLRHRLRPAAPGRAAARRADPGVQPAGRPAAGGDPARPAAARFRGADRRRAGRGAVAGPGPDRAAGPPAVAAGAPGDPVLPARAGRPGGAVGRPVRAWTCRWPRSPGAPW